LELRDGTVPGAYRRQLG